MNKTLILKTKDNRKFYQKSDRNVFLRKLDKLLEKYERGPQNTVYDDFINLLSIESKSYDFFNSSENFQSSFLETVTKIQKTTFLNGLNSYSFVEQNMRGFFPFVERTDFPIVSKKRYLNNEDKFFKIFILLISSKIAVTFLNNVFMNYSTWKNDFYFITLDEYVKDFTHLKYKWNLALEICTSLFYTLISSRPEGKSFIPQFVSTLFRKLIDLNNNNNSNDLFSNVVNLGVFTKCILRSICRYRSFTDSASLSLLQLFYNSNNNPSFLNEEIFKDFEDLLFNVKIEELQSKTINAMEIIKEFINVCLEFNQNENNADNFYSLLSYIFSFLSFNNFSPMNSLAEKELNGKTKKDFNKTIAYIQYSLFIIDCLRVSQEKVKNTPEEIKYVCLYNYMELAGRLSESKLASMVSCYIIKEIVLFFSFKKFLSKVVFNLLSYFHHISLIVKNKKFINKFYSFVEELFNDADIVNGINPYNDWSFLSFANFDVINGFKLSSSINVKVNKEKVGKHLIAILAKIKYVHLFEQVILLDYIDQVLDVEHYYKSLIKDEKFMKKIKRKIAYLLFNNEFFMIDQDDANFMDHLKFNRLVFQIINKLLIEDLDEYFIYPKKYETFLDPNNFISHIDAKTEKYLKKYSILSYDLLTLRYYLNIYLKKQELSKENEAFFSYTYIFKYTLNNKMNKNTFSFITKTLSKIIEVSKCNTQCKQIINLILNSGLFNLKVAYFLLPQLLVSEPPNFPIQLLLDYMKALVTSKRKYHLYHFVSVIKYLDNLVWFLIDTKYISVLSELKTSGKKYNIYKYILSTNQGSVPSSIRNKFSQLKDFYHNLSHFKAVLSTEGIFKTIISLLSQRNLPKTCINVIEKVVYDEMADKNIRTLIEYPDKDILRFYFYNLGKLGDNKTLLNNYFEDKSLFNSIKVEKPSSFTNLDSANFLNYIEIFFLTNDWTILLERINTYIMPRSPVRQDVSCHIYVEYIKVFKTLNRIIMTDRPQKFLGYIHQLDIFLVSSATTFLNKTNDDSFCQNNMIFIFYEIEKLIKVLKESAVINKKEKEVELNLPNEKIHDLLEKFITKRKLPYMLKYLTHYKIRRLLCNLTKENILEMICVRDIVKVLKHNKGNDDKEIRQYLKVYRELIFKNKNEKFEGKLIYTCLKYHYLFCNGEIKEFEDLYQLFVDRTGGKYFKFEILKIKNKERKCCSKIEINKELYAYIKPKQLDLNKNDEEFCAKADLYLKNLYSIHQAEFTKIKTDQNIKRLTIFQISPEIFNFIKIAVPLCMKTDDNKYLTQYLPELINILFKIQIALINFSGSQEDSATRKKKDAFEDSILYLRSLSEVKIRMILPQLVICYIYPDTVMYSLAVCLLGKYAEKYIDLVGFLFGSSLCSNPDDNRLFCPSSSTIFEKFKSNIKQMKKFFNDILEELSDKNKRIIEQYLEFQNKLKEFFLVTKAKDSRDSKERRMGKIIAEINDLFTKSNFKIILPNLSNLSNYDPKVREESSNLDLSIVEGGKKKKKKGKKKEEISKNKLKAIDEKTLYICGMDKSYREMDSKEKPLRITFQACLFHENSDSALKIHSFNFLLKGDLQDISKELKTSELFNEINSLLHLKHYDENYSMTLKRYLISPISSQIALAEWVLESDSMVDILNKLVVKSNLDFTIFTGSKDDNKYIRKGSLKEAPEKFNLLYKYIHQNHPDPNDWYNYQQNYIISTALWSITCFFVGLGDRHGGNIMINSKGEVTHIDFGYVAGKGRSLPVPEIVDFRFTKNIRRSLGLFEENGEFLFLCQKTLEMFKEYYNLLKCRLEYFAFDPFFIDGADYKTFELLTDVDNFFKEFNYGNCRNKTYQLILRNGNEERLEEMYRGWSPYL